MGAMSRRKGKASELEVVRRFKAAGFPDACRNLKDGQVEGDLLNVPDYVEIRRRETLAIPAWTKECREKSGDREWALVFRRSNEPWTVALDLDHYLQLLEQNAAQELAVEAVHATRHYVTAGGNVIAMADE